MTILGRHITEALPLASVRWRGFSPANYAYACQSEPQIILFRSMMTKMFFFFWFLILFFTEKNLNKLL